MSREDWEVFDLIKAERKAKREKSRGTFGQTAIQLGWTRHVETHYSRDLDGSRVDYWPGPKKWRYKGKMMFGDVNGWLRKRDPEFKAQEEILNANGTG